MFPVGDNRQSGRTPQSTALMVLFGTLIVLIAGGVALIFEPAFAESPIVMILVAVAVLAIAGSVGVLVFARMSSPKTKRALDGLDMYTMIDRLVDDIDDDEAAYLQRRLAERKAKNKDDLTVSLDDLLEQRSQNRGE